ncbi:MAG: hypothetical protein JW797_07705 [Bradymonadales bacterium]|nr:hypothetical protein [Bradymonadales bacterium]
MSWFSPARAETRSANWRRFGGRTALLVLLPALVAIGANWLRTDGLPLISDTNYIDEILVPCPENLQEARAVRVADLPELSGEITIVDARNRGAFLAGHIPGAINIPHRPFNVDNATYQAAIERDLDPLRGIPGDRIVVCGETSTNSGRDMASVLMENGFSLVRYLEGGCDAWQLAGRPFEEAPVDVIGLRPEALAANLEGITLIDARFTRFYRRGHLPGALAIPYAMLSGPQDEKLDPIRSIPGDTIVVYGSVDYSEGDAMARVMAAGGWPGVRYLEGGFEAWQEAGLPVEGENAANNQTDSPASVPTNAERSGAAEGTAAPPFGEVTRDREGDTEPGGTAP